LEALAQKASDLNCDIGDEAFAIGMDKLDPLSALRDDFMVPKASEIPTTDCSKVEDGEEDCIYLCGNSLGLMPKKAQEYVQEDMEKWGKMGVHGHFVGPRAWALADEELLEYSAKIVGANPEEVAVMNGLTVNLHLLMISFYKPSGTRKKILLEAKAFPSDHYAVESQIALKGNKPEDCMVMLEPREGEHTLRTEDILKKIDEEGDSIALVLLPGVQYYTGQLFDMKTITAAAKAKGCVVGFDLAHAVGNAELHLHDWGVDFACWCSYKYLNSGAGGLAGAFIHNDRAKDTPPALTGWWGHRFSTRFEMSNEMEFSPGVSAYRLSNPPMLLVSPLLASLEVFMKTDMAALRSKSRLLTGYLEYLILQQYPADPADGAGTAGAGASVEIITPADPEQRGCQLSLMFSVPIKKVFDELEKRAVVCDKREPNVIRIAPAPIYNSFSDVYRFTQALSQAIEAANE
jgi:kynureninase